MTTPSETFSSEGFDLDAIPASDGDVVHEIGGTVTTSSTTSKPNTGSSSSTAAPTPSAIAKSEEFKKLGNDSFKAGDYETAYASYSDAIDNVPSDGDEKTGEQILELKVEFDEKLREERIAQQRRKQSEDREKSSEKGEASEQEKEEEEKEEKPLEVFTPPPHRFSSNLAVYHCNRAACLLHMEKYEEVIRDSDIAILFNPMYVKAYLRRMNAYEQTDEIDSALRDARTARKLDPSNRQIKAHVARLEKLNEERLEKLKSETLGQLKDLGNSLLSNFGLSLDNFKAQKDPNTGSYNISFENK
eukprot:CAMPEP_0195520108 /NCGR_PEP_ID=MMETSP0794_2-20130614/16156_1 /TAXON_ID=515487 /ORGANISM="Stephanopyxis turris, Strain CCMP 815" /LENGTH=301 /DNA_ID=CAMNT_0040649391 /DNA_START=155 /DNA_END=1060 /DNA_ORIENTATION=+